MTKEEKMTTNSKCNPAVADHPFLFLTANVFRSVLACIGNGREALLVFLGNGCGRGRGDDQGSSEAS